jgi:ribA/ribD-fused uncharacterized protein
MADTDPVRISRSDAGNALAAWSPHGFEAEGVRWPSAEHFYQGMKFEDEALREQVRAAPLPRDAQRLAKGQRRRQRRDWEQVRRGVMAHGLYLKCRANPEAAQALLATGGRPIVETSQYDYYWGCGRDGRGHNQYGRLLMAVREKLRGEGLSS